MNKKGFTLIELLAVIVILAIILVVAVPKVLKVIDSSRLNMYNSQLKLIENAATNYLTVNNNLLPQTIGEISYIKLSDLIDGKYINQILDPKDKSICDSSKSVVKVENIGLSQYKHEVHLTCSNYTGGDTNIPIVYTSVSGTQLTVKADDDNNLMFNGIVGGSYAEINYTFPETLTIEAWGYGTLISGKMLWSFTQSSGPDLFFSGILTLNLGDSNANPFGGSVPIPAINEWHHYAVVFDKVGNIGRLYIDGVDKGTAIYKTPVCNKLYLGRYVPNSYNWGGIIKDVRVWNTIRTQSDIVNNMNNTLTGTEPGLLMYYKLDEGTGSTITDYVSNNSGIISGTTWQKNSGIKQIRIKQASTVVQSSNLSSYTFTLASGTYTVEVEDNVGNVTTKTIVI